jgi:hypothetical protein
MRQLLHIQKWCINPDGSRTAGSERCTAPGKVSRHLFSQKRVHRRYAQLVRPLNYVLVLAMLLILFKTCLKELSHEIETGCRWCECVDLYLKRCLLQFINFLIALSIFNSN